MVMQPVSSWGRLTPPHDVVALTDRAAPAVASPARGSPALPFGNGRSYGDVCLNDGGVAVGDARPRPLHRLRRRTGVLECEAGVTLDEVIDLALPQGWFLPVTPGTQVRDGRRRRSRTTSTARTTMAPARLASTSRR